VSWAVGDDRDRPGRFIGYGVPAACDRPGCGESIDRGMSYACGGGVMEDMPNCGLFFCTSHLTYAETDDQQGWVCERCAKGEPPFDATPDVDEWVKHVLADESWAKFRAENPEWKGFGR
jgi:hypothetical protein